VIWVVLAGGPPPGPERNLWIPFALVGVLVCALAVLWGVGFAFSVASGWRSAVVWNMRADHAVLTVPLWRAWLGGLPYASLLAAGATESGLVVQLRVPHPAHPDLLIPWSTIAFAPLGAFVEVRADGPATLRLVADRGSLLSALGPERSAAVGLTKAGR
jgi:hypothetical protein